MSPILNVELGEISIRLHVKDLSSGLREASVYFRPEDRDLITPYLEDLSADSMEKMRAILPGLRVTGHYFLLDDSSILDGH